MLTPQIFQINYLQVVTIIRQVCLVEQRGTKKVLAMKYVNKVACAKQGGISSVFEHL